MSHESDDTPLPRTPASMAPSTPTRPRLMNAAEAKSTSMFPRSVSLSKKGFLKGMKGAVSNAPEPKGKEKSLEKTLSNEDGKRWHVFGFRRRREASDSSSTIGGKYPWSPRRGKDASAPGSTSSSRSSTPPVPAIPRNIPNVVEKSTFLTNIHPALRTAALQNALHRTKDASSQKMPTQAIPTQTRADQEGGSARGSVPASACTISSSFGESKPSASSVISPDSFHSAVQETGSSDPPVYSTGEENPTAPLLW